MIVMTIFSFRVRFTDEKSWRLYFKAKVLNEFVFKRNRRYFGEKIFDRLVIATIKILLIDDDIIEVMKFSRVISSRKLDCKIIEANDGEEALRRLEKKDDLPDIILLDLNMPKINGIEFLSILKNDETLKYIPCVILTTSNNERDLIACYKTGIAGYVLKPLKYEDYAFKIEKILAYWSINELKKI
jgi:CheY-like chemotaxis protein